MAFHYSRSLTVTNSSALLPSTQTDFPVLVYISSTTMKTVANGGHINSSGAAASGPAVTMPYDLVFTSDSAGATKIPWEVDFYDGTNGILWAWVKIASCALSTVFYVFYGDATISSAQNTGSLTPANVWDASFKGVWHVADGTSLFLTESTSAGATLTNNGATVTTGQVDGGTAYNGSTQYVTNAAALTAAGAMTVEAWAYSTSIAAGVKNIYSRNAGGSVAYGMQLRRNAGALEFYMHDVGGDEGAIGAAALSATTWTHVAGVWTGGNPGTLTLYKNGVSLATKVTGLQDRNGNTHVFGADQENTVYGQFWGGSLDELRLSATNRSADWLVASYASQNAPATFITVGSEVQIYSLFSQNILSGIGSGGQFFHNPLN